MALNIVLSLAYLVQTNDDDNDDQSCFPVICRI